jgi:hypothetical protein
MAPPSVADERKLHRGRRCCALRKFALPYTIRVTVLSDPQGATFAASKFIAKHKDLGQADP